MSKVESLQDVSIVLDGPPGNQSGRFIEVETRDGRSIKLGTWREGTDGYWYLDIRAVVEEEKS